MALLAGWLTQVEFEDDLEAEKSKVVGMENVGMTGETQLSVMEVDEEEDEVAVVVEVK